MLDRFIMEFLKKSRATLIEWLVRLSTGCFVIGLCLWKCVVRVQRPCKKGRVTTDENKYVEQLQGIR